MTASSLKSLHEYHNPQSKYFDKETMRFFGDTMKNFSVLDGGVVNGIPVWELHRRRPVNGGLHGFVRYFRKDNGKPIHGVI